MPSRQNMANAVNHQNQMQQNLVNGVNAGNDHDGQNQLQHNVNDINVGNDHNDQIQIQQNEGNEINAGNGHNDENLFPQDVVNGGDVFPKEHLLPPGSGDAAPDAAEQQDEAAERSLQDVYLRGVELGRRVLFQVAKRLARTPLSEHAYDFVNRTLAVAEQATESAQAAVAENESLLWCVTTSLSVLQMAIKTGLELTERFLDIRVMANLQLVNYLEELQDEIGQRQERAGSLSVSPVDVKQACSPDLQPDVDDSSSVSSLSDTEDNLSEEESTVPENPGEKTMYFSVDLAEQPKEQEDEASEGGAEKDGDRREIVEEGAQGGKGEEQQLAAAAAGEAVAGASAEHGEPAAAPGGALSAAEAERAALSAGHQPPPQPQASAHAAASEDLLAAEASSRPEPGTSARADRPSRVPKRLLFLNVFGTK